MHLGPVLIEDTFAEAFRMWASRLVVTALDDYWLDTAIRTVTGYATSVIACDAEAALERLLPPDQTPDGRPGAAILFFAFNAEKLAKALPNRTGQCLMTCPTTAVFDGMPEVKPSDDSARIDLGKRLRFFGDAGQISKLIDARRYWRVPVMDGEFLCEESATAVKAIAGGNFLLCGPDQRSTLAAARAAVDAIAPLPGVITPFPGGVVRSGSKVGSRYKGMFASTNDAFCPTLRGQPRVASALRQGVNSVYEIVINGLTADAIASAMRAGITAACTPDSKLIAISAGNYGGNLGKFHFKLHPILSAPTLQSTDSSKPPDEVPRFRGPTAPTSTPSPTGYTLTLKPSARPPADGAHLRPDTLGHLAPDQLRAHPALRDFDITGSPGQTLTLRGLPALHRLGMKMTAGELIIEGDAGDDLGASMSAGLIRVRGNAGHRAGGPAPDQSRGMTAGQIVIQGNAGDHTALRMRGGLIAVAGRAGASPAYRMIAGTLVLAQGPLDHPGLEMQRGTILCLDRAAALTTSDTFAPAGLFPADSIVALRLILAKLIQLGLPIDPAAWSGRWRLFNGDRLELAKGELWQWAN